MRLANEKLRTPLFSVAARIASSDPDVYSSLVGWSKQYDNASAQSLLPNESEWEDGQPIEEELNLLHTALDWRVAYRPGMLLNAAELAGMVHLPRTTIVSDRLRRVRSRTKAVTEIKSDAGSVVLGENTHRGKTRIARVKGDIRLRHCCFCGSSGTGKSTTLLNLASQDISEGRGAAIIDPHGDLVEDALRRIPTHRGKDVVLFDPSDVDHPMALNILHARGEHERERVASEVVMSFEKNFPSSWGPRLERILLYAIRACLEAVPHATLADVEQLLVVPAFQQHVAGRCRDAWLRRFWTTEIGHMPRNAADPVLNKLSPLLSTKLVRNIVCQRGCAIDFDDLLNHRKVLLCNLSSGPLTEKIANTFGSFIVSKLVNASFRRARIPLEARIPFYVYCDEFQSMMNLSVGFERILSESRKYRLAITMANQYVAQLDPAVRGGHLRKRWLNVRFSSRGI